uniref:Uncharacterized protein n=1 Tax=Rhizophora mucronata TaxID=61149 RepID=A0A2P2NEQ0_RHIMU
MRPDAIIKTFFLLVNIFLKFLPNSQLLHFIIFS